MGRTHTTYGIVLQTHNIGEADRFCIVLSEDHGRLAARAYGVRKPKSRLGGSLLPLQELHLTMRESSSGWHITDGKLIDPTATSLPFPSFLPATQAAEILLAMLEDHHTVPEIYAALRDFLHACRTHGLQSALPFTIQILVQLGLLPTNPDHAVFAHLQPIEKTALRSACSPDWRNCSYTPDEVPRLSLLCAKIIENHSQRPLKAAGMSLTF